MYVLGISAYYHDSSACLFKNGELIFACEEEKFTGIKHDSSFPVKTLEHIFKTYNLNYDKIEAVCYYEDPKLKLKRVINNIKPQFFKNPIYCIKSYLKIRNNINELNMMLPKYSNKIHYSTHHESHIYYSHYTSPFKKPITLSIDGVGELDTMSLGFIDNSGNMAYESMAQYPHSLGLFYSAMTSFLGFKPNEGEYKVMGLASYGNPNTYLNRVRKLISFEDNELKCNMDMFTWNISNTLMFNENLIDLLDLEPRIPGGGIEPYHNDLAASVQRVYEEILFSILNHISTFINNKDLCLAGGCAYNGTANGKIINNTLFENLWIPPAPSDAGSAIGACIHYLVKNKKLNKKVNDNPFLGPSYTNKDIIEAIGNIKQTFKFPSEEELISWIARKIKDGKTVGWFNGNCEFGSRALGNRSILASPLLPNMKDKINSVIKKREGFRPFAPAVTKERQNDFYIMNGDVPYMNQVVQVRPSYRDNLPAVTHIDGSARVQTVSRGTIFYNLLREFESITGYPILLNTSFNVKDKTMVLTPKDAIKTFFDTELDILVLNNYIVYKQRKS
jgi:carbamoyltransferase